MVYKKKKKIARGQFWPPVIVVACVCPSIRHQVCQRDNSSPVQARPTKFGPKMRNTLVKVSIVFGGNRPWPSRSNLTSKSKFTPFLTRLHHNSSPIQARITKFGPEVQNNLVKIPVDLGGQLTLTFKVKFDLTSWIFWIHHYWKYITTI